MGLHINVYVITRWESQSAAVFRGRWRHHRCCRRTIKTSSVELCCRSQQCRRRFSYTIHGIHAAHLLLQRKLAFTTQTNVSRNSCEAVEIQVEKEFLQETAGIESIGTVAQGSTHFGVEADVLVGGGMLLFDFEQRHFALFAPDGVSHALHLPENVVGDGGRVVEGDIRG